MEEILWVGDGFATAWFEMVLIFACLLQRMICQGRRKKMSRQQATNALSGPLMGKRSLVLFFKAENFLDLRTHTIQS